jgi:hypothetical protein
VIGVGGTGGIGSSFHVHASGVTALELLDEIDAG